MKQLWLFFNITVFLIIILTASAIYQSMYPQAMVSDRSATKKIATKITGGTPRQVQSQPEDSDNVSDKNIPVPAKQLHKLLSNLEYVVDNAELTKKMAVLDKTLAKLGQQLQQSNIALPNSTKLDRIYDVQNDIEQRLQTIKKHVNKI